MGVCLQDVLVVTFCE